jgi:hypothetical protein
MVREFFELQGFFVRQQRKSVSTIARDQDEIDFLVYNPAPRNRTQAVPFVLEAGDVPFIERAVVVVKAWHTETFSTGLLTKNPEIFRFLEPTILEPATRAMGGSTAPEKILVVPALPAASEARTQSLEMLRGKGLSGVISFRTILADLIAQTEAHRNYQKSDLLQVLRILKTYNFLKEPQLELFKARSKSARPKPATSP